MTNWYVKDLSKLTGLSVQTLHYYDRINLLKPSLRLPNGYRVYSEVDLIKLQRIIALKSFGFDLKQISALNHDILQNFIEQKRILQEKQARLQNVVQTLNKLISDFEINQTVNWQNILNLIGDYQMLSQENYQVLLDYEKSLEQILTAEEFNQYVYLKDNKFSNTEEYKAYTQEWIMLSNEAKGHLNKDPFSPIGEVLAEKWINLINRMYPKEYRDLQKTIWDKGYKTGKIKNDVFPKKIIEWISNAMENYYKKQATQEIAKMQSTLPTLDAKLIQKWKDLMQDMYGRDQAAKDAFCTENVPEAIMRYLV